jgi:hypothetical protein
MADPILDSINATTLKEVYPRVVYDNYFLGSPLQAYLRARCMRPFGGGAYMQNTFLYGSLIGGAYAKGGANFNLTKPQILSATLFDPKYYEVNVSEYLEDIDVINKGPNAVFSLVDIDMQAAVNTLSTIIALDLQQNGQSSRVLNINGWVEAYNDGTLPDYQGNVWSSYGTQTRNGAVGSALNSSPYWFGTTAGAGGPITYAGCEEMYQGYCRGLKEPDLMTGNKAVYAYVKERMQVQQRFQQERDPYWGVTGFRFNNAIFLKDDYFPSLKFGQNDPNLGNWLTTTITNPLASTGTFANNFPNSTSAATLVVGEVLGMFNTDYMLFRLSDSAEFGFGFTGFIRAQDNTRVAGQTKAACNLQITSPWSGGFGYGITG